MSLDSAIVKPSGHQTWDAFITRTIPTYKPMFVSEAGPAAYDALLCWSLDPLQLNNEDVPVVEAKTYFSSLLALALGHESIFFSKQNRSFKPTLPKMRISGYSHHVLQGLEKICHTCGSTMSELRAFVQSTYSQHSTRCGVALASVLDQVLQVVHQHVAVEGRNPRSLLQLQRTIKGVMAILGPFKKLTSQLHQGYSDEELISLVFHQSYSVEHDEENLRHMMRETLRRVSRPWTEFIEEWIGTRQEEGIPLTKSDLGRSKGFVKIEGETYMDDFGQEVTEVDFRLDRKKVPRFMPDDVVETIFETGRNLRFIRSCHPDHPLAQPGVIAASYPPKAEWLYDWGAILQLEARVSQFRDKLLDAVQESSSDTQDSTLPRDPASASSKFKLQFFGVDANALDERIEASMNQFSQPIVSPGSEDSLGQIVRQRLRGNYRPPAIHTDSTPHWSLLPVLSFGGIASAQAQVVNKESLRLLFASHDLRGHLKLQRDFHLLGNGLFCSRLTHALFDPELETAERQIGIARQGGVMGLRLGGRDSWPPASSELRLALMGVLAESYDSQLGRGKQRSESSSAESTALPGDLSFAVRDLSPEEIDRCMNPDSLEALDFLRLSYKTPSELTSIITPVILIQYDRIFKLLVRVLRLLYVIDQMFRDVNSGGSGWKNPSSASYRFVIEAHHFISTIAAYFLDTGVALPWKVFEDKLDKIQADLDDPKSENGPEKLQSPDKLREFHSHVLERITMALFLRKRQQPVLKLLEEIFNSVLQFAKYSRLQALGYDDLPHEGQTAETLYRGFRKKVQIFITVCRGLSEKSRIGGKRVDEDKGLHHDGTGEESMVAQLLMKLDMFEYYSRR